MGCLGGVEKFAWYLNKAIGCDILIPSEVKNKSDYDVIIADGYHADGYDTSKQKVISVVHGTWKEFAIRNDKMSDFSSEANRQETVWGKKDIIKVAVSNSAAKYLLTHHGVKADNIILNGVDTNIFKPVKHNNNKPVIIHAANDYNKDGQGKLQEIIKRIGNKYEFRYLNAKAGEEHIKYAQGDLFIQTSRYEGLAFAGLEAMSCGLPVVATKAGLYEDTKFDPEIGIVLDWNSNVDGFCEAIEYVVDNLTSDMFHPREWILNNASFEIFAEKWRKLIYG